MASFCVSFQSVQRVFNQRHWFCILKYYSSPILCDKGLEKKKKKMFENGKIASEELFQMKISGIMVYKFCIFYVENFKLLQVSRQHKDHISSIFNLHCNFPNSFYYFPKTLKLSILNLKTAICLQGCFFMLVLNLTKFSSHCLAKFGHFFVKSLTNPIFCKKQAAGRKIDYLPHSSSQQN